mmetsp:Transcript_27690/g.39304  ORF Transcript_27690/g.39304 Transcript_27690/m.39304 type:complete len:398 (+) Transcript_27690:3-1196(+)
MIAFVGSKKFRLDSVCKLQKSFASTFLLARNQNFRPQPCQRTLRYGMASESDKNFPTSVENVVVSNTDVTDIAMENINSLIPSETLLDAATTLSTVVPQKSGWATTVVMNAIENIHLMAGIPYWEAIVLSTVGLRILLIPIVIKTIQSTARLALLRPEMQKIQDIMAKDPKVGTDPKFQLKYQNEMKALFIKYKVNPLRAMIWPLFQFPIFITFFLALQDMGKYYPDFVNGGAFWFVNLAAPDATFILPVFNSLSFLVMLEIGADGVQMQNQQTFKWAMRGLAVAMVPLTMSLPQGLFVYWAANNTFSIVQTFILKNETLRLYLDIPKPPAVTDTPALKVINPFAVISEIISQEKSKGDATEAEILDGPKKIRNKVEAGKEKVVTFTKPPKVDSVAK